MFFSGRLHSIALVIILTYFLSISTVSSHSVFMFPKPYNVIHCNLPECTAPCPRVWSGGLNAAQNSPGNSVIWKRGQLVDVGWHKNNHYGGFVRHSLVPIRHMYEPSWHRKTAFEWGCFSQGFHKCTIKVGPKWDRFRFVRACGTDAFSTAFGTKIRIPRVFKDGNYVLATLWFGGIDEDQKKGELMFPDYHMCAFVRIRGGMPLTWRHTTQFNPGVRSRFLPQKKCRTFATREKQCGGWPCRKGHEKAIHAVPQEFERGRPPPVLKRGAIEYDVAKKWVKEEAHADRMRKGWTFKHTLCHAAHRACMNRKNPIRHVMCDSCHAHFCRINACPWCWKHRNECVRSRGMKTVKTNGSVGMLACKALHYACFNEMKPSWLRRSSCFACQSSNGCDGINCWGNGWCTANAARCRALWL